MAQEYFDQLHEAVKQAESRGQRFDEKGKLLTSPKGAEGEMQVLPKTARKPGFGVEPAKSRDPDEIARVGRDYLKAMVDKYGDTEKALVAYNWGPKNADDWLASGADKSKLPKETQGYITRVFNNLNTTPPSNKPAPAPTTEPTPAEKIMTGMTGMSAKADIKDMARDAGPGYKAAMAMMFLADDKPDDDKTDVWKEAQPEAPDLMAPSALADLSLEYKSPFPEKKPVRMADGGEAKKMLDELPNFEDTSSKPFEMIKGGNKMNVEDKQIEDMMLGLGTNSSMLGLNLSKMKQGEKENLAQNLMAAYRTKVGDTDVSVMGMRPTGAPPGTYMGGVSAAVPVYGNDRVILGATGMQSPYQSGMTGVNLGYSGQVGPGRLDAMMMQPVNSQQGRSYQVQYRLPVGRAEGSPMGGEMSQRVPMEGENTLAGSSFPATRSQDQLRAYVEALNPRANIVVGDLGGTTRGFVTARKPDTINLSSTLTPGTREITTLHELEHSMDVKGGDILGRPEIGTMDNNYRAYHLLGKDWAPIRDTVKNMVDNKEKIEKFFGRPIDDAYFRKGSYNNLKKSNDTEALFSEQLATLSALEQATGKFLTHDPEMRQLFPNYQMMAVYDALTGPRQTRMDAKDLPPHLPVPSYTYSKNPVERFLIKSITGENEYGTQKQPIPIKRADGSPMGGENVDHLTPQEIERMAMAQRPAFGVFPQMQPYRSQQDREASANVPVDVTRGRFAGTFGVFGDVANQPIPMVRPFQLLSQAMTGQQKYPDTEYFLENLPLKSDTPVGTATGKAASFVPLNPMPVVRGMQELGSKARTAAQDLKTMLQQPSRPAQAPAAQAAPVAPPVQPVANNNPPGWDVVNTGNSRFDAINARAAAEAQMPAVAPVAPPVEIPVPTVDPTRPFVGRLDAFVDQLKGPVPLGQFVNQLKGKFREYDIARVEEAFKGVDPTTKLTPKQIAEGLANTYSPSRWISETVAPGVRKDMAPTQDTVWGTSKPFGTTNLFLEQPPERIELSEKIRDGVKSLEKFKTSFDDTTLANPSGFSLQDIDKAKSFLTQEPVINAIGKEKVDALTAKLDYVSNSVASIEKTGKEVYNLTSGFMYPALYQRNGVRVYDDIFKRHVAEFMKSPEALKLSDSFDNNLRLRAALDEAAIRSSREVQEMAAQDMLAMGSNTTPDLNLVNFRKATPQQMASGYANTVPEFKQSVENAFEPILRDIHEAQTRIRRHLNPELAGIKKNLDQLVVYRGHHGSVTNSQPYPIGFTRFTEHTANIPMKTGEAAVPMEGRHFHELQSDLSRAMRERGTTTGSAAKDQAEYDVLEEKLSKMRADNTGGPTPEQYPVYQEFIKAHQGWVEDKMKQLKPLEKRLSILGTRLREKAPYSLEEPFAGFETNSRLRQQVMMKNAIQSAIRDGKQFATFPGQESKQPQLYVNKIEPNLKQIVKELGGKDSGFEIRRIELPNPKSNKTRDPDSKEMVPVWGIVWSPEAAARIMKTGVPFAKGGSVDKSNTDYRAYI
jgi:hypothetical protein